MERIVRRLSGQGDSVHQKCPPFAVHTLCPLSVSRSIVGYIFDDARDEREAHAACGLPHTVRYRAILENRGSTTYKPMVAGSKPAPPILESTSYKFGFSTVSDCAQFCAPPPCRLVAPRSGRRSKVRARNPLVDRRLTHTERYQAIPAKTGRQRLLTVGSLVRIRPGEPRSSGVVHSFLISPVTPAMKIALSSHPAMICAHRYKRNIEPRTFNVSPASLRLLALLSSGHQ